MKLKTNTYIERNTVEEKIFKIIARNGRKFSDESDCVKNPCLKCKAVFFEKLASFIDNNKKLEFILPAFPAKSPNPEKTAGYLPDLGEKLSLNFINTLCEKISTIYKPGADIIICSDGRVFNDLVNVSNKSVTAYRQEIEKIITQDSLKHLKMYDLESKYNGLDFSEMRKNLIKDFAQPVEKVINDIKQNETDLRLFNGIHRFIYEDYLLLCESISKNKVRQMTKEIAYYLVQRSNAWSNLIKSEFENAIRLSIHPQMCGSEKFGINLVQSKDAWITPWHGVILQIGEDYHLVKRKFAESLAVKDIRLNNKFSHYRMI